MVTKAWKSGNFQRRLADLGYYNGAIDAIFGGGTEMAVIDFQRDAQISRSTAAQFRAPWLSSRSGPLPRRRKTKSEGRAQVVYVNQHSIRNRPSTAYLEVTLATAVYDVYGPGYQALIFSGGQPRKGTPGKRTGGTPATTTMVKAAGHSMRMFWTRKRENWRGLRTGGDFGPNTGWQWSVAVAG